MKSPVADQCTSTYISVYRLIDECVDRKKTCRKLGSERKGNSSDLFRTVLLHFPRFVFLDSLLQLSGRFEERIPVGPCFIETLKFFIKVIENGG